MKRSPSESLSEIFDPEDPVAIGVFFVGILLSAPLVFALGVGFEDSPIFVFFGSCFVGESKGRLSFFLNLWLNGVRKLINLIFLLYLPLVAFPQGFCSPQAQGVV